MKNLTLSIDLAVLIGGMLCLLYFPNDISEWTTYSVIVYYVGIRPILIKPKVGDNTKGTGHLVESDK